jgi:hypothetical protein
MRFGTHPRLPEWVPPDSREMPDGVIQSFTGHLLGRPIVFLS